MFPLKTFATGALLLLLAAAGFIYALTRPKPQLEDRELVQLRLQKEPANEPREKIDTGELPVKSSITRVVTRQPEPLKTFAVKILSPRMAENFTAPAMVTLTATANRRRELRSIEFYRSPQGTVCQSLSDPEPFPIELKIGEVQSPPYQFVWNISEKSTEIVVAVATYANGEKQISPPVVFFVNGNEQYDGPEWKGWQPPYPSAQQVDHDFALKPEPTPTPTQDSCPAITVKSLPVDPKSNTVTFQATVSGNEVPADVTFSWHVSAGGIVSGQNTSTINVAVDKTLDPRVVAAVEIGHLPGICSTFASASVSFEQPPWITKELRDRLSQFRSSIENRYAGVIRRYIELHGDRDDCVDEALLEEATLLKRYLVEFQGMKTEDLIIVNAGHSEDERGDLDLTEFFEGEVVTEELQKTLLRPLALCRDRSSVLAKNYGKPVNRSCPDIDEAVRYSTSLNIAGSINTCPYNPRDPINTKTQLKLYSNVGEGTYSNYPTFEYWANAGKILNKEPEGIWDLSDVKLKPGVYAAISKADDSCDCTNIDIATVAVKNFCTPCLTMERKCSSVPEERGLQFYSANARQFAVAAATTFHWTTTKGKITRGQGSPNIVIDTRELAAGERFLVTLAVGGLMPYCVNKLSQPAVVEEFECREVRKFDEYGNVRIPGRRARRRPQPQEFTESITETPNNTGRPGHGPVYEYERPGPAAKEWMKISWTPHVKTDDAVTVKVVYNRTTESFQVSDAAGNVSEEVNLEKPLAKYFGADYRTLGDIRLKTAGLKCDSCNQEQYQSFDKEKLEWSWPLKPEGAGTQLFSVELWIKGEPREIHLDKPLHPPEKVWFKTDNKVYVTERFLTRNTFYAGGGLCAVLGLGLCVRGLKIYRNTGDVYNVEQAVAVGRNVTMTNTTVNQQAAENKAQNGENKDG